MTEPELEPMAYIGKSRSCGLEVLSRFKNPEDDFYDVQPLYTREQLRPRVRMTKTEYDSFVTILNMVNEDAYISDAFALILNDVNSPLYKWLFNDVVTNEREQEFCQLWYNFNLNQPQETIELLAEHRWFVRSNSTNDNSLYGWLSRIDTQTPVFEYSKTPLKRYVSFDTQEQATVWTNPSTKAVYLPID